MLSLPHLTCAPPRAAAPARPPPAPSPVVAVQPRPCAGPARPGAEGWDGRRVRVRSASEVTRVPGSIWSAPALYLTPSCLASGTFPLTPHRHPAPAHLPVCQRVLELRRRRCRLPPRVGQLHLHRAPVALAGQLHRLHLCVSWVQGDVMQGTEATGCASISVLRLLNVCQLWPAPSSGPCKRTCWPTSFSYLHAAATKSLHLPCGRGHRDQS